MTERILNWYRKKKNHFCWRALRAKKLKITDFGILGEIVCINRIVLDHFLLFKTLKNECKGPLNLKKWLLPSKNHLYHFKKNLYHFPAFLRAPNFHLWEKSYQIWAKKYFHFWSKIEYLCKKKNSRFPCYFQQQKKSQKRKKSVLPTGIFEKTSKILTIPS